MQKKSSEEYQKFDEAMKIIIRADPKAVKAAVDAGILANTTEREVRGEHRRGRKPKITSASDRASNAKG